MTDCAAPRHHGQDEPTPAEHGAQYVAPARYVLTAVHIVSTDSTRTLCGRPMDEDGLWQPVDFTEPACRACEHVAARKPT